MRLFDGKTGQSKRNRVFSDTVSRPRVGFLWFRADRNAAAYLVLAMAETELKQTTAARNSFEKGCAIVERKLPRLDSKDLGNYWQDGLIANLLLREARTLIKETSEPVTDPAKAPRP